MAVKKTNTNSFWGTFARKAPSALKSGIEFANAWEMQQFQKAMQEAANKRAEAQEARAADQYSSIDKPIGLTEVAWAQDKADPAIRQAYKDYTLSGYGSGMSENLFNTQLYDRMRQPDYLNPMIDAQISGFTSDLWGNRANAAQSAVALGRGADVGLSPNAPIQLQSDYALKSQEYGLQGQQLDLEQKQYESLITNALIEAGIPEANAKQAAAQLAAGAAEAQMNQSQYNLEKGLYDSLADTEYNKNRMDYMLAKPGLDTEALRLGNKLTEAQIWSLYNPKDSSGLNIFNGFGGGVIDKDTLNLLNKQYEYDRNKAFDEFGNPVPGYENFPTNFLEYLIEYDPGVFFSAAPILGVADPQKYYEDYIAWKYSQEEQPAQALTGDEEAKRRQASKDKVDGQQIVQNLLAQTKGDPRAALAALISSIPSMKNVSSGAIDYAIKQLKQMITKQLNMEIQMRFH